MTIPNGAVEEFASTYREWHYLVGGAAVGFMVGVVLTLYYVRRILKATGQRGAARPRR